MDTSFKRTEESIQQFKKRLLAMQSAVNKRLARIEEAGLTEYSIYRNLREQGLVNAKGQIRFSVKGKNWQELQTQYYQMMRVLNAKTGSVKAIRQHTKDLAKSIGFKFSRNGISMQAQLKDFFHVYRLLEDYYDKVQKQGIAMDYRRLFRAIEKALSIEKSAIGNLASDTESLKNIIETSLKEIGTAYVEDTLESLTNEFKNRITGINNANVQVTIK